MSLTYYSHWMHEKRWDWLTVSFDNNDASSFITEGISTIICYKRFNESNCWRKIENLTKKKKFSCNLEIWSIQRMNKSYFRKVGDAYGWKRLILLQYYVSPHMIMERMHFWQSINYCTSEVKKQRQNVKKGRVIKRNWHQLFIILQTFKW